MIAYCGLNCDTCPVHLITLEGNPDRKQQLRVFISAECKEKYGIEMTPDEVGECDGCRSVTGLLFSGCWECKIRKCAIAKGVESCAFCEDFACDKLEVLFNMDPEAKSRLEDERTIK